jgi:predicted enzyme related to lactoylglutathione lyase
MSEQQPKPGTIAWADLTVLKASELRDFYQAVVGWTPSPVSMGDYDDFNMTPPGSAAPAAGICHARGNNASLPPQWVLYVPVTDLAKSLQGVQQLGGQILYRSPHFTVIRDPAGAVLALMQS